MKKPATAPRRRSKRPTLRFKLDGEWWIVKVQRPPSKELCEGMTDFRRRVVYFHPQALKANLLGIVAHESATPLCPAWTKRTSGTMSGWCLWLPAGWPIRFARARLALANIAATNDLLAPFGLHDLLRGDQRGLWLREKLAHVWHFCRIFCSQLRLPLAGVAVIPSNPMGLIPWKSTA
jgi:hypothetical protein